MKWSPPGYRTCDRKAVKFRWNPLNKVLYYFIDKADLTDVRKVGNFIVYGTGFNPERVCWINKSQRRQNSTAHVAKIYKIQHNLVWHEMNDIFVLCLCESQLKWQNHFLHITHHIKSVNWYCNLFSSEQVYFSPNIWKSRFLNTCMKYSLMQ